MSVRLGLRGRVLLVSVVVTACFGFGAAWYLPPRLAAALGDAPLPHAQMLAVQTEARWFLVWTSVAAVATALTLTTVVTGVYLRRVRGLAGRVAALAGAEPEYSPTWDELDGLAQNLDRVGGRLEATRARASAHRRRMEAVLEGMDEGVIAVDAEGRVRLVNRAAEAMLGATEDALGQPLSALEALAPLREVLGAALDGAAQDLDLPLHPKTSLRRDVRAHLTPTRGGGAAIVLHDETRLRHLERMRRDFVANVSHELRTPVAVIRANSETLLDGAMHDEARGPLFLEAIQRNATRLGALISDLLDLSGIEAGAVPIQLEPVSVTMVLNDVVTALGTLAIDKGVELKVEATALFVQADLRALGQVMHNLVDNAIKYTPSGGHVCVRACAVEACVRLEVVDDGPGIAPKHEVRIFERFFRSDAGRSRAVGGTGLGLAIVKHLVGAMGGRVGVERGDEQGAQFWVELPEGAAPRLRHQGQR